MGYTYEYDTEYEYRIKYTNGSTMRFKMIY